MTLAHTFIDPRTWLTTNTPNLSIPMAIGFMVLSLALIALGVVASLMMSKKRKVDAYRAKTLTQLTTWFVIWGILGLLWTFSAYEQVNLFGAPFWVPIGIIAAGIWLATILRFHLRMVPKLRAAEMERAAREKYLPKRKR